VSKKTSLTHTYLKLVYFETPPPKLPKLLLASLMEKDNSQRTMWEEKEGLK